MSGVRNIYQQLKIVQETIPPCIEEAVIIAAFGKLATNLGWLKCNNRNLATLAVGVSAISLGLSFFESLHQELNELSLAKNNYFREEAPLPKNSRNL